MQFLRFHRNRSRFLKQFRNNCSNNRLERFRRHFPINFFWFGSVLFKVFEIYWQPRSGIVFVYLTKYDVTLMLLLWLLRAITVPLAIPITSVHLKCNIFTTLIFFIWSLRFLICSNELIEFVSMQFDKVLQQI